MVASVSEGNLMKNIGLISRCAVCVALASCMSISFGCEGEKDPFEQVSWIYYESKEHKNHSLDIGTEGEVIKTVPIGVLPDGQPHLFSVGFHLSDEEFDELSSLVTVDNIQIVKEDSRGGRTNLIVNHGYKQYNTSIEKSAGNAQETRDILKVLDKFMFMNLNGRQNYTQVPATYPSEPAWTN